MHHEVCRSHVNRLGTAPSKEPTWNYEPTLPGSVQREFPWSTSMAKKGYTEGTWQLKGCRLEKQIAEFKRAVAAYNFSDTFRDTPVTANQVAQSWHGGCMAANFRAFHLGRPLKTVSLMKNLSTHAERGWASHYYNPGSYEHGPQF